MCYYVSNTYTFTHSFIRTLSSPTSPLPQSDNAFFIRFSFIVPSFLFCFCFGDRNNIETKSRQNRNKIESKQLQHRELVVRLRGCLCDCDAKKNCHRRHGNRRWQWVLRYGVAEVRSKGRVRPHQSCRGCLRRVS